LVSNNIGKVSENIMPPKPYWQVVIASHD
jgi:hypothetical protein